MRRREPCHVLLAARSGSPAYAHAGDDGGPDGDVIIVVTDEPASEVRAALLSARLVRGYNDLLIIDRDDRPDVAELAERLDLKRVVGGAVPDLGILIDQAIEECTSLFAL